VRTVRLLSTAAALLALAGPGLAQDDDVVRDAVRDAVLAEHRRSLDRTHLAETPEDRAAAARIARVLDSRKVTVNFDEVPFAECVEFMRDVSGLNVVLSTEVRERLVEEDEVAVTLRLREIGLRNCFELLLKQADRELRYGVRHGVLVIGFAEEWHRDEDFLLDMLPAGDLVHDPPDFPAPRLGLDGLEYDD